MLHSYTPASYQSLEESEPAQISLIKELTRKEDRDRKMKIVCSGEEFRRRFLTVCSSPREVSPSAPAVTEMEAESESSVVSQPPPGTEPDNREGSTDEVRSPKGRGGAASSSLCVRLMRFLTH